MCFENLVLGTKYILLQLSVWLNESIQANYFYIEGSKNVRIIKNINFTKTFPKLKNNHFY